MPDDPSARGFVPSVVCLFQTSIPHPRGDVDPSRAVAPQETKVEFADKLNISRIRIQTFRRDKRRKTFKIATFEHARADELTDDREDVSELAVFENS
jgi:hypothetical protein